MATIEVDTFTAPAYWASYLINRDASGLDDAEIEACDAWVDSQRPWYAVDVVEDSERFTWSFQLYGGTAQGGDVCYYVMHSNFKG